MVPVTTRNRRLLHRALALLPSWRVADRGRSRSAREPLAWPSWCPQQRNRQAPLSHRDAALRSWTSHRPSRLVGDAFSIPHPVRGVARRAFVLA